MRHRLIKNRIGIAARFDLRSGLKRFRIEHADVIPTAVAGEPFVQILSQRYARGEIDSETFDQMRERLESVNRPRYP